MTPLKLLIFQVILPDITSIVNNHTRKDRLRLNRETMQDAAVKNFYFSIEITS